jgi:hypothetical protein
VDEAVFSPQTKLSKTWSLKKHNIRVADVRTKLGTMTIVAGISIEQGLEHFLIHPRSIKQD